MLYLTYMSTFDRFLNHVIKVLLVCITCIMLIIGLLFVTPPVYALDTTLPIPIVTDDLNDIKNNGIPFNIYKNQPVYLGSLGGEYTCCYVQPSTITGAVADFYVFSDSSTISDLCNAYYGGYSWSKGSFTLNPITESDGIYYGKYGVSGMPDSDIPIFGSLEDALSAVGGSGGAIDVGPKEFDIPAGYAYYILTNGGSATLTTKFTVYNNIFTGSWSESNQRIGISETRVPSSGYTFGSNTGTLIPWHKLSTADSNILGQTRYAQYIYTNCPDNGNYLVIYNPVYAYDDDVTSNVNGTIHVEISNFVGANRFALRSSLGFNGSVDSVSPDDYTDFESTGTGDLVVGNDSSLTWYDATRSSEDIDSSTGSSAPAPIAPYNDTSSVPDNNTFLGNLVERIVSFLEAPIQHIKSLQDAAANFMGWLANLWKWLPETVVVVIVDALIVLIVIGVVKFLWK